MVTGAMAQDESYGGTWTGKGYAIKGGWHVTSRDDKTVISFDEKFKTRRGPDLKVYLSTSPIEDLQDRNVEDTSVLISPLKSNKGPQEYVLPDDVKLDDFRSVVIHCEAYSHLWGGANLPENAQQD